METIVPMSKCPECGHNMDAASSIGGDFNPRPGDLTCCIQCGELLAFNEDLHLRLPTKKERANLAADPKILGQVTQLQILIRGRQR
jgi:hypothetical protein